MARLEELTQGAQVEGVVPGKTVAVVQLEWLGSAAVTLFYKDDQGRTDSRLLYREDEPSIHLQERGRSWSFDADGAMLRLVAEAHRPQ